MKKIDSTDRSTSAADRLKNDHLFCFSLQSEISSKDKIGSAIFKTEKHFVKNKRLVEDVGNFSFRGRHFF
jgi:hypothetical protein